MGETRVDLLHLLEDLRDAYPGALEETILTEIAANSLVVGVPATVLGLARTGVALARFLAEGMPLEQAVAAPRMNTTGGIEVALNKAWTAEDVARFAGLGFQVKREAAALEMKQVKCLKAQRQ